jgi:pimeloyl-ACP methyl ester carboxylesterase
MASVQANGITIEYEEQGSGEPLLLVMGLGGQLIDWPQELVDLIAAQGFRVIRHDNRDAGLSTEFSAPPPTSKELIKATLLRRSIESEYLLSDMADDAVGLLDVLGIESAHVVGVSMGGMIAQAMAIGHPDRVRSLTSIMSTTGNRRVGQPKARLIRLLARRPDPTPENAVDMGVNMFEHICGPTFDAAEFRVVARAAIDRSWRPAGTGRQTAAIMASGDRTEALTQLQVPALVVHGMLDPLVRPSGGMATAKAIPGSRLLMFNDMAHDLPHTRWVETAESIALNASRAGSPAAAGPDFSAR